MAVIAHPITAGADGAPAYTADNFRRNINVWLSPADIGANAGAGTCVGGVRNEDDKPLITYSDGKVTVVPHTGIMYPIPGGSPYTYTVTAPETIRLSSTTETYKIVVSLSDPSAGQGSTISASIEAVPSSQPTAFLSGLILGTVQNGIITESVPRLLSGSVIRVNTLDQLKSISTTNGQYGQVAQTGVRYISQNQKWFPIEPKIDFNWTDRFGPQKDTGLGDFAWVTNGNITVAGLEGRPGALYFLDMGAWDQSIGLGRVYLQCRIVGTNASAVYTVGTSAEMDQVSTPRLDSLSKAIYLPNGNYLVQVYESRYKNGKGIDANNTEEMRDSTLTPKDGPGFSRYVTLTHLSL